MKSTGVYRAVLLALAMLLAGCSPREATGNELSANDVEKIAWEALEPNTSSHDRSNWKVVEVQSVQGARVAEEFDSWVFYGYCPGPEPPRNRAVEADQTYWLVRFETLRATPAVTPLSPTAPPAIPEPFLYQAGFLIHPNTGQVLARYYHCVIY
ncbi:MAG: hypothetical protein HPY59_08690 [Anaerolineae bacterium]|nr:hypothetical protein [Anaerolineae bacterium]